MAGKKNTSGSPDGEPVYLTVGFLRRPHGVQGEIMMDLHTDFPERMKKGRKLFVGEEYQPMTLTNVRPHQAGLLVKFNGLETPEDAGKLRNQWVYIKAKDATPLREGQIYQHELFGFRVVDENDNALGELVEIIETGANDVYVIRNESGKELLLPAIPSVILNLDTASRLMRVHLLEGL
ncbi:MAG TPA: ribosome maturation factor RimM [Anaerolineales bacterium]|nr:ribosome maturation factor RimM [Anaerolineales bacterium]